MRPPLKRAAITHRIRVLTQTSAATFSLIGQIQRIRGSLRSHSHASASRRRTNSAAPPCLGGLRHNAAFRSECVAHAASFSLENRKIACTRGHRRTIPGRTSTPQCQKPRAASQTMISMGHGLAFIELDERGLAIDPIEAVGAHASQPSELAFKALHVRFQQARPTVI